MRPSAPLPRGSAASQIRRRDPRKHADSNVFSKSLQSDDRFSRAFPFVRSLGIQNETATETRRISKRRRTQHYSALPLPLTDTRWLCVFVAIISEDWLNRQSSCERGRTFL